MNLAIPAPGVLRVELDHAVGARRAVADRMRGLEIPDVVVELRRRGQPTTRRPDHVLSVRDARHVDGGTIAAAVEMLRGDLSTAAVGPSFTGAPAGELELAVGGQWILVRADALDGVGGWDHEGPPLGDIDLCLRLWLAGHRARSSGATSSLPELAPPDVELSMLRALATTLEDESVTAPAWAETEGRAVLDDVRGRRAAAQRSRRRGDGELVPMAHAWARAAASAQPPLAGLPEIVQRWGAPHRAGPRRRVLVVTTDVLAPAMAGPGIRAVAIASALATEHEVQLVTTSRCDLRPQAFDIRQVSEAELRRAATWSDIVIFQGWVLAGRPWLRDSDKVIVVDAYDPMHLEQLEQGQEATGERGRYDAVRGATATLNEQLRRADLVLCASAKQRDLWLGALATLGRVNAITYDDDPSLRALLRIVPFGVADEPFPAGTGAIKGKVPGIALDDLVVLWGGGVYNWFDPLTLVRAIDRLRSRIPSVRLYFLGLAHPNPDVPEMRMVGELRALVDELGLEGTHVFFNDGWVPHDERAEHLRDADVGVSTHLDHLETEFSFRTRILDYLWAGLPIVATGGDAFADLIEAEGAGWIVPPGDVDALAGALEAALTDDRAAAAARAGSQRLAEDLSWAANLAPLVEFCREARRAPDVACPTVLVSPDGAELSRGLARDLRTTWAYLRTGGLRLVVDRASTRVGRRWSERRRASASDQVEP